MIYYHSYAIIILATVNLTLITLYGLIMHLVRSNEPAHPDEHTTQ